MDCIRVGPGCNEARTAHHCQCAAASLPPAFASSHLTLKKERRMKIGGQTQESLAGSTVLTNQCPCSLPGVLDDAMPDTKEKSETRAHTVI